MTVLGLNSIAPNVSQVVVSAEFEKYFTDHTEMKVFSAKHSASEKPRFPNYVSMYWRSENAT